jgi:hypothetical protein
VLGTLVVGYAYFAAKKFIATVERHERERQARKLERDHLKSAQ